MSALDNIPFLPDSMSSDVLAVLDMPGGRGLSRSEIAFRRICIALECSSQR